MFQLFLFSIGCFFGAKIASAVTTMRRTEIAKDRKRQAAGDMSGRDAGAHAPQDVECREWDPALEGQTQIAQMTFLTRAVMLGELSGALAHELSGPLTAILSNVKAAQRTMATEPLNVQEIREILDDIRADDQRASEMIRRLRALYMRSTPTREAVNLNRLVGEVLFLTHRHLAEHGVRVIRRLHPTPPRVHGDPIQLQQVLLNLILNACEAMRDIETPQRELIVRSGFDQGGNIFISIADTGSGIPAELIGRLFDPFFSTKPEGMGLGLSISRFIVLEHGGEIKAMNNTGRGAIFRFTLPDTKKSLMEPLRFAEPAVNAR